MNRKKGNQQEFWVLPGRRKWTFCPTPENIEAVNIEVRERIEAIGGHLTNAIRVQIIKRIIEDAYRIERESANDKQNPFDRHKEREQWNEWQINQCISLYLDVQPKPEPKNEAKPVKELQNGDAAQAYPVPAWMDDDLKPIAAKHDVLERHALADKLERQALQLREMNPPGVKAEIKVEVSLRPNVKRAVAMFAERFGCRAGDEKEKLSVGIRWFLEVMLPKFKIAHATFNNHISYCEAEGLDQGTYSESLIGDALENWKASQG